MSVMHFRLPNAVAGKHYEGLLHEFLPDNSFVVEGLDIMGLEFDAAQMRLHGVPTQSGEFRLRFFTSSGNGIDPELLAETLLIINPDPKGMWTSIEPPADSPFPSPAERLGRLETNGNTLVAASKRGRSHAREGKFREDEFGIWHHPDGIWSLMLVSDGAGSAEMSRQGAATACMQALAYIEGQDLQGLAEEIARSGLDSIATRGRLYHILSGAAFFAHKEIRAAASNAGGHSRDYACTFAMLLHGGLPQGHFFAGFGIGDSPLAVVDGDGIPHILHMPEEGDFSGQTNFLTQPELFVDASALMARIQSCLLPDFRAAFAMTDGIYDAWFETRSGLGKQASWAAFLDELASKGVMDGTALNEGKLLEWLDFWSIGNHDDRTIVILA